MFTEFLADVTDLEIAGKCLKVRKAWSASISSLATDRKGLKTSFISSARTETKRLSKDPCSSQDQPNQTAPRSYSDGSLDDAESPDTSGFGSSCPFRTEN